MRKEVIHSKAAESGNLPAQSKNRSPDEKKFVSRLDLKQNLDIMMRQYLSRFFVSSFFLAVLAGFPQRGLATVLTFEDLPNPADESHSVPDGYGGIEWSAGDWQYYGELQPPYTPYSGTNRVFSYNGDNTFFFSASDVVFEGAWFSGGSGTNDTVHFELYRGGLLVGTSPTLLVTDTPTFLASGFTGLVDAVSIAENPVVRPNDTDFVMDDVTFHSSTATPEPASAVLSLLGLVGAMLLRKKVRVRSSQFDGESSF